MVDDGQLTIGLVSLFMFSNTTKIKQSTFKYMVLCVFISIIYDIIWFALFNTAFLKEGPYDGSAGKTFKTFLLAVSYIAFIFKVRPTGVNKTQILVALVFWKDYLDFTKVITAQF